ncbi:Repeat-containing protein [Georgfuchsia toluolica]|uniref:Repeat-containing protein n=2 Tax=Georgfuchsia toluolica TaxID=424218 RepID=A0A916J1V4_9PROT|nr:Repeat-containing protein [Georgfuchsia toluolica]
MFFRWRIRFAILLIWASVSLPAEAVFLTPLDTPAHMSPLAQKTRLSAVARAGRRLVAVGPMGHILVSDDAGKNWKQVAVPLSSDLVAVQFPTAKQGWAVGHDGVVLHSDDGGLSWVKQLDGKRAAEIIDAYYKKFSAGPDAAKWQDEAKRLLEEGADKPFLDVLFVNELEGYVVGAFNLALRTKDGGKSWEPLIDRIANEQGFHLYSLAASDSGVFIAGEQGLIRRWDLQHERFMALASPYQGSFFGILAKGETLIVFGMRGNILRSTDGGQSWRAAHSDATDGITAGTLLEDGRVVLVTQGGQMLVSKDGGDSFVSVKVEKRMAFFGVAPAGKDAVAVVGTNGVRIETIE